jgi:hypothetical protein
MSNPSKLLSQVGGAFARPAQRRTGIATRHRLNQPLQGLQQARVGIATALATSTWFAQARIDRRRGLLSRAANSANPLRMVFGDMWIASLTA